MFKRLMLFAALLSVLFWATANGDVTQSGEKSDQPTPNSVTAEKSPGMGAAATKPVKRFINFENARSGGADPPVTLEDTTLLWCPTTSVFGQEPYIPPDIGICYPSDFYFGTKIFENYTVSDTIRSIHLWGLLVDDGGQPCDNDRLFDVTFYNDNGMGMPDTTFPVCSYTGVYAFKDTTGFYYYGAPLWRFDLDDPFMECDLYSGWISIQGSYYDNPGCYFYWMSSPWGDGISFLWDGNMMQPFVDQAFCLTNSSWGAVEGTVTDANTGSPIEGAEVTARMGAIVMWSITDQFGFYGLPMFADYVKVTVEKEGYVTDSQGVWVVEDTITTHDVALTAPEATIDITPVVDTVGFGDTAVYSLFLYNTGTAPLDYRVTLEEGGGAPGFLNNYKIPDINFDGATEKRYPYEDISRPERGPIENSNLFD
ncbi:MAG: carboxypeptidase regulatory-like domain-containing protein, partial [Candidatus Zixiibacteriota bacterium]